MGDSTTGSKSLRNATNMQHQLCSHHRFDHLSKHILIFAPRFTLGPLTIEYHLPFSKPPHKSHITLYSPISDESHKEALTWAVWVLVWAIGSVYSILKQLGSETWSNPLARLFCLAFAVVGSKRRQESFSCTKRQNTYQLWLWTLDSSGLTPSLA